MENMHSHDGSIPAYDSFFILKFMENMFNLTFEIQVYKEPGTCIGNPPNIMPHEYSSFYSTQFII